MRQFPAHAAAVSYVRPPRPSALEDMEKEREKFLAQVEALKKVHKLPTPRTRTPPLLHTRTRTFRRWRRPTMTLTG